jgi:hypothetical protein
MEKCHLLNGKIMFWAVCDGAAGRLAISPRDNLLGRCRTTESDRMTVAFFAVTLF